MSSSAVSGGSGGSDLLRSVQIPPSYAPGFKPASTLSPSGPTHTPTLNGVPSGVFSSDSGPPPGADDPHTSFCVENPFTPEWARMVGSEAGNPKQSGSMYSTLALPNSLRNQLLPYNTCRMIVSALGVFTSPSSIDEPAGNHLPSSTYFFTRAKSAGKYSFMKR